MDNPQPRTRRQATYGSSAKDRSLLKATPAHSHPTKRSKGSASRPHQPQAPHQDLSSQKPKSEARSGSDPSTTELRSEPRVVMGGSVYDLPSSSEEDKGSIVQRKRRRDGSNSNNAQYRNRLDVRNSAMIGTASEHHCVPFTESDASNVEVGNPSPRTRKSAKDRGMSLDRSRRGGASPPTVRQIIASQPANRLGRSRPVQNPEYSSGEREPPGDAKQNMRQPASPSPRKFARTFPENNTPSRRRLIDSLGTQGYSTDGASSTTSSGGPLPSPFTLRSPNKPKDIGSPIISAESQRAGLAAHDSAVPHSPHLKGSRVTYARQRSFLDDLPMTSSVLGANEPSGAEQVDSLISSRRNTESLVPAPSLAIEEVNGDDGSVRSIHELRQAGGNARYKGAIDSIFEDIENPNNSVSSRCNAFVQLCGKLLDPRRARQFIECGFEKRLVDCFSSDLDVVSTALAFCAFSLSFNGKSMPYLLATTAWPKLLDMSHILVNNQDDISTVAQSGSCNISKTVQRSVHDISPRIMSALFDEFTSLKLSPCVLALRCLEMTISAFQEKGETPSGLPTSFLKQLVNLLSEIPRGDESTVLAPHQSLILVLGLSVLEAHTTLGYGLPREQLDFLSLLFGMYDLLQWKNGPDTANQRLQTLYIRVVLNVTNNNPVLHDDFETGAMVGQLAEIALAKLGDMTEESLAQENNTLDTVILALGVLINMTEQSEVVRTMFFQSRLESRSLLDRFLHHFSAHVGSISKVCSPRSPRGARSLSQIDQAHSVLEVHHNVAVGYLAVLLLALCLHADIRAQVKRSMHPNGLSVIMSTVEEFLQYHRKIEQELDPVQAKDGANGFIGRLQNLMSQIQGCELE